MKGTLYFFCVLIMLVGIFGFACAPDGGWITLPITAAIGGLAAIIVYLHFEKGGNNPSEKRKTDKSEPDDKKEEN